MNRPVSGGYSSVKTSTSDSIAIDTRDRTRGGTGLPGGRDPRYLEAMQAALETNGRTTNGDAPTRAAPAFAPVPMEAWSA